MTADLRPEHPLRRLFGGLVEQVFMVDIGICDPQLTDYLGDMLADFVHVDRIYRLSTVDRAVIRDVSRMEAEAHLGPDLDATRRRRLISRYIGDFTLFWTGVYPENLHPRHQGGVDRLTVYVREGKRSYGIAGELTAAGEHPPAHVLRQLSEQFEYCVHGLQLVRAGWERRGGRLMGN
jgi:hypothetical protein